MSVSVTKSRGIDYREYDASESYQLHCPHRRRSRHSPAALPRTSSWRASYTASGYHSRIVCIGSLPHVLVIELNSFTLSIELSKCDDPGDCGVRTLPLPIAPINWLHQRPMLRALIRVSRRRKARNLKAIPLPAPAECTR